MKRSSLYAGLASLLFIGSAAVALAQDAPPPPPHPTQQIASPMYGPHRHYGDFQPNANHHARGHQTAYGSAAAVIADLHQLQRLYTTQGKPDELVALYKDVLSRSKDQRVRNYAYQQLAKAQARPTDVAASIATLRKSLDENLAALNQAKPTRKP